MGYDLKPVADSMAISYISYVIIYAGIIEIDAAIKYANCQKIQYLDNDPGKTKNL